MTGPGDRAEDIELWRRWRATSGEVAPVDAVSLAAYAEGRMDEAAAEAVEAWLADHPEALADVAAARGASLQIHGAVPEAHIVRAMSLVTPAAEIVQFPIARVARRRTWREAAAWGAIAASLLVTSMFGFELGSNAYANLMQQQTAAVSDSSTANELIDPPTGLFTEDDEPAT